MWVEDEVHEHEGRLYTIVNTKRFRKGQLSAIGTEDGLSANRITQCACAVPQPVAAVDFVTEESFKVCGECRKEIR